MLTRGVMLWATNYHTTDHTWIKPTHMAMARIIHSNDIPSRPASIINNNHPTITCTTHPHSSSLLATTTSRSLLIKVDNPGFIHRSDIRPRFHPPTTGRTMLGFTSRRAKMVIPRPRQPHIITIGIRPLPEPIPSVRLTRLRLFPPVGTLMSRPFHIPTTMTIPASTLRWGWLSRLPGRGRHTDTYIRRPCPGRGSLAWVCGLPTSSHRRVVLLCFALAALLRGFLGTTNPCTHTDTGKATRNTDHTDTN